MGTSLTSESEQKRKKAPSPERPSAPQPVSKTETHAGAGLPLFLQRPASFSASTKSIGREAGGEAGHHQAVESPRLESVAEQAATPLPYREQMERAFSTDLGDVRVQLGGGQAEAALDAANAHAATLQDRIVFGTDAPSPDLVAHEVTHVMQQHRSQETTSAEDAGARPSPEQEAKSLAKMAARGQRVEVAASAPSGVPQLDPRDKRGVDTPSTAPPSVHANFTEGEAERPEIRHDHGFLDDGSGNIDESLREEATIGDYLSRAKWIAMLEGAELLRPDLVDGTSAYRHFLFGGGATRPFNYERFIANDSSGATVLNSAIEDTMDAAREHHNGILAAHPDETPFDTSFDLRSAPIGVGNDGRYPYPATENWQKAIGAHIIWIESHVDVSIDQDANTRTFDVDMTIHVEDMYNFNPGAADIASKTPDAANGRFEITGLGHEFLQTASVNRYFYFEEELTTTTPERETSPDVGGAPRSPGGPPDDSRGRPTAR